jgi:hypothetical protein
MIKTVLTLLLVVIAIACPAQMRYFYDDKGKIFDSVFVIPKGYYHLTDKTTGTRYILDSSHIVISAVNALNDTLWKTDPWKDNHLETYRIYRPTVSEFILVDNPSDSTCLLYIIYSSSQMGCLSASGRFSYGGRD